MWSLNPAAAQFQEIGLIEDSYQGTAFRRAITMHIENGFSRCSTSASARKVWGGFGGMAESHALTRISVNQHRNRSIRSQARKSQ